MLRRSLNLWLAFWLFPVFFSHIYRVVPGTVEFMKFFLIKMCQQWKRLFSFLECFVWCLEFEWRNLWERLFAIWSLLKRISDISRFDDKVLGSNSLNLWIPETLNYLFYLQKIRMHREWSISSGNDFSHCNLF